jgi:hypothetical protein
LWVERSIARTRLDSLASDCSGQTYTALNESIDRILLPVRPFWYSDTKPSPPLFGTGKKELPAELFWYEKPKPSPPLFGTGKKEPAVLFGCSKPSPPRFGTGKRELPAVLFGCSKFIYS